MTFGAPLPFVDEAGCEWLLSLIGGWDNSGSGVRRADSDRPQAHGAFDLPGWRTGRSVGVSGTVLCPTRALAASVVQRMNSLLASGQPGELTVADADLPTMGASVRLADTPVVDWSGHGGFTVSYAFEFWAADPLRYGTASTLETGFPVLAGGLEFDLFTSGTVPGTTVRTNRATNPVPVGTTGYATAGLTASDAGDGWQRLTTTTGSTAYLSTAPFNETAIPFGTMDPLEVSVDVRAASTPVRLAVVIYQYAPGGTEITTARMTPTPVDLAAGESQRLTYTVTPAQAGAGVRIFLQPRTYGANAYAAGNVVDWRHLMAGEPGPYFDGAMPDTASTGYGWTGTANASTSTATTTVHVGDDTGYLEFGEQGSTGRVSVSNEGTADSLPQFTVTGPVPPFQIVAVNSGRRLVFSRAVNAGDALVIDSATGVVVLNGGDVDYSGYLTTAEWTAIPAGGSESFAFLPVSGTGTGTLAVTWRPAWW